MAAARDSDISLWLHNKLGTSADTWSEGSICSQLNVEVLRNIKECFVELQTQVKLKLLLSFFHIPKRNVEEVGRWEVLCVRERRTRVPSVPRLPLLMMLLLSHVCPDTLNPESPPCHDCLSLPPWCECRGVRGCKRSYHLPRVSVAEEEASPWHHDSPACMVV